MTQGTDVTKWDEDSMALVDIAAHFLCQYFEHEAESARHEIRAFLVTFGHRFDEDFAHQYGPYCLAAVCHYIIRLGGTPETAGDWLSEKGHLHTPPEALEYFREHYFI